MSIKLARYEADRLDRLLVGLRNARLAEAGYSRVDLVADLVFAAPTQPRYLLSQLELGWLERRHASLSPSGRAV